MTEYSTIKAAPPNSAARLALSFPPPAACRFLDFSPVSLQNLHLHPTKNICHLAAAFAQCCLNDLTKGSAAMKRIIGALLVLMFLFPASALADLKRGDRGEEVRELQQMLWDTGFIFEEPDGVFGGNTEKAVKWFQEYALLKQTGVVDDRTIDSLYACWLQIMEENGYDVPDDEMEPQTAGFAPGYNPYGDDDYSDNHGDYPAYCHRYTTDAGDEHIEMCGFHAQLAANQTLPGLEKWTYEFNDLYNEWIDLSMENARAAVASSQAFFMLWLEQQRIALELQNVENVDDYIEAQLRNQCVDLCSRVYAARTE